MSTISTGIVSTMKGVSSHTDTWLEHHFSLGISKAFIFIDRPEIDRSQEERLCKKYGTEKLKFFYRDEKLDAEFQVLPSFERNKNLFPHFVTIRQMLGIEFLMLGPALNGLSWVFHLDDDELLYFKHPGLTLSQYLQSVPERYDQLVLENYEALIENPDEENFFHSKKFKKSPPMVSNYQLKRFRSSFERPYYFVSYNHGKFGFNPERIKARSTHCPDGVHRFHIEQETTLDANFLHLAILHFPFPNFGFYYGKFSGVNSKRIYEYEALGEKLDNFYTRSRTYASQVNLLEMEKFFHQNVVYDLQEVELLKELKLLMELDENAHA